MADPDEFVQALRPVVAEFNRLGVRYYVGGSVASTFYGAARSTMDVDISAELDESAAKSMIAALRGLYYVSDSAVIEAVRRQSCFNLLHLNSSFKIDVFVSRGRAFDRQVQERAIADALGDADPLQVRIASAEDIVLLKLEWYRRGNEVSERQWDDITRVMKLRQHALDEEYLRHWAGELGVSDLLERLFTELQSPGDRPA